MSGIRIRGPASIGLEMAEALELFFDETPPPFEQVIREQDQIEAIWLCRIYRGKGDRMKYLIDSLQQRLVPTAAGSIPRYDMCKVLFDLLHQGVFRFWYLQYTDRLVRGPAVKPKDLIAQLNIRLVKHSRPDHRYLELGELKAGLATPYPSLACH